MKRCLVPLFVLAAACAQVAQAACPPLLDHTLTTLQGEKLNLCEYAGNPILVVNTASKCGYTPQFEKLEAMYERYKGQGLLVVGFPSNDFRQEFNDKGEVARFCKLTYKVKFPMIEPSSVRGGNANPLFKALAAATGEAPLWNFHKYLIAPDGSTVHSFGTRVEPDEAQVMDVLRPMLH